MIAIVPAIIFAVNQAPVFRNIEIAQIIEWPLLDSGDYWSISEDGKRGFGQGIIGTSGTVYGNLMWRDGTKPGIAGETWVGEIRLDNRTLIGTAAQIKDYSAEESRRGRLAQGVNDRVVVLGAPNANTVQVNFRSDLANLAEGQIAFSGVVELRIARALTDNRLVFMKRQPVVMQAVGDRAGIGLMVEIADGGETSFFHVTDQVIRKRLTLPNSWLSASSHGPSQARPILYDSMKLTAVAKTKSGELEYYDFKSRTITKLKPPKTTSYPTIGSAAFMPRGDLLVSCTEHARFEYGGLVEIRNTLFRVIVGPSQIWQEVGSYEMVGSSLSGRWALLRDSKANKEWLVEIDTKSGR